MSDNEFLKSPDAIDTHSVTAKEEPCIYREEKKPHRPHSWNIDDIPNNDVLWCKGYNYCANCGTFDGSLIFCDTGYCSDLCRKALEKETQEKERAHNELHPPAIQQTELEKELIDLIGYLTGFFGVTSTKESFTMVTDISLNTVRANGHAIDTKVEFLRDPWTVRITRKLLRND